jgi:hypothetical protein
MAAEKSRAWKPLLVLLVLALVPRIGMILSPRADLFGPPISDTIPNIQVGEEIARGNMALDLIEGPLLRVLDYQYAHWFGGSTVTGLLAAPSFLVFGPRLAELKLIPVLFHLLAVVFFFLILDRFVSRRAAWIGSIPFAISTPGYALITTIAWGSHMESSALALLCVYLFLGMHAVRESLWRRFAFGLAGGFAIYFGYQCGVFLAVLVLFELLRDWRVVRTRAFAAQVAGAVVGLLPWLLYNLRFHWAGLTLYGKPLTAFLDENVVKHGPESGPLHLFWRGLPGSFFFPDVLGLPGRTLDLGFAFVLSGLAAWALLRFAGSLRSVSAHLSAPREETPAPRAVPIALVYMTVFLGAFLAIDFEIGDQPDNVQTYRYAMPLFPFLYLAAASGLDSLLCALPQARARALAWGVPVALGGLSLLGDLSFCDASRFGEDWDMKGYSIESHGLWMTARFAREPEVLERIVERASTRTHEQQVELYKGMGKLMKSRRYMTVETPEQERLLDDIDAAAAFLRERVPEAYKQYFTP